MHRVTELRTLETFVLQLTFEDQTIKAVDLRPFLGKGISAQLLDPDYFRKVEIDSGGGITWPNGYDFCASFLYEDVPPIGGIPDRAELARRLLGSGRKFSPERDSVAELIAERKAEG